MIRTVAAALEVERIDDATPVAAAETAIVDADESEPIATDAIEIDAIEAERPSADDVIEIDLTDEVTSQDASDCSDEEPTDLLIAAEADSASTDAAAVDAVDAVEEAVRLIPDEFVAVTDAAMSGVEATEPVDAAADPIDEDRDLDATVGPAATEPEAPQPAADPIAELPESLANLLAELSGPETVPATPLTVSDPAPLTSAVADNAPVRTSFPLDDADFVEIIAGFVGTLRTRVQDMQVAMDSGDLAALAGHAHWLKGGGGTMGFDDFTEPAGRLEAAAGAGDAAACRPLLATICSLTERVEEPQVELV